MLGTFHIDENSGIPIWVQLKSRITYLIYSGHYSPGEQLPSVRELAIEFEINYNTVNKVYLALERDGLIMSKRGRGTFVRTDIPRTSDPSLGIGHVEAMAEEFVREAVEAGMGIDDIKKLVNTSLEHHIPHSS